jgi:NTP pyrophosphatase (non-canonical NTP hydrolase)
MTTTRQRIFDEVSAERERQDVIHGAANANNTLPVWALILGEEVGEVNKAILEGDYDHAMTELIQVAAVCVAIREHYESRTENV